MADIITKKLNGTDYAIRKDLWDKRNYEHLALYSNEGSVTVRFLPNGSDICISDETVERVVGLINDNSDELIELLLKNGAHLQQILNY